MALFFGHALPYMATNNDGNLYAELLPADQRVEAASGTQEIADGCLDSRVVDLRSRVEEQLNANLLFNSSMAGATGSVLPTNWASGSVSGLTYTISSASAVAGFQAIEWTVSGTALSDGDIYLACEPMQSGSVVAQIPSEYVGSMYCAKVSGTIKAAMVLQTLTQNFVDGAVQETKTKDLAAVTGTTFVRIEPNSVKTDIDLENRVNLRLYQPIASGEAVDFTIRVAAPQVEAGFAASPFISTVSGAVSEVRGRPSILVVPQLTKAGVVYPQIPVVSGADFTFTRDTTATRVNASGLIESVASGVLRLDYPIGGGCPAALIEPSAQNLAFNVSGYSLSNATTGSLVTSPDGTANAITFVESSDAAATNHQITTNTISFVSGNTYTYSVFFKAGNNNRSARLAFPSGLFVGAPVAFFDITSGSVLSATDCTGSVESYANGWYRCAIRAVCDSTGSGQGFLNLASGATRDYIGNGSGSILAWGAQMETGAIPTSYIPTTTGSATRNADVCSVSGVSGYIGQTQGTIYVEVVITNYADAAASFITISDNTINNRVEIRKGSLSSSIIVERVSSTQSTSTTISATSQGNGVFKMAVAYKSGDTAFFINGVQVGTTNADTFTMTSLTRIYLGSNAVGSARFLNDRIRAAALYTTRLTNDQLAQLTK